MLIWMELAKELGERCSVSTHRDIKTVADRSKTEGSSYLTITLPLLGKAFDKALDLGQSDPSLFTGFQCRGRTPKFLGEFFDLVFDRASGVVLDEPSASAIVAIRQLTRLASKVALDCSERSKREAFRGFVKTDEELEVAIESLSLEEIQAFGRMARRVFGDVLAGLDNLHSSGELTPRHGPGSTADRLLGNEKYDLRRAKWHWRLEHGGFHSVDFLLPNARYWKTLARVPFLKPENEPPVKVTAVPKTPATPRIISLEPVCMQYTQQAVLAAMKQLVRDDGLVSQFLNVDDQSPNRIMARKGSMTGQLATIDLSEASDRVAAELVYEMASYSPSVIDALFATRSTHARVPGHGVIHLTKYASMGSALCFMVEQMVFLTIIFMSIEKQEGRQLSRKDLKALSGKVRVFGDDIIVPTDYAVSVMQALETYGLKVNLTKSFWEGYFRESCGKEYFRGYDVSVVKLRTLPPASTTDATEVVSLVSFRNQLDNAGYVTTVEKIDEYLLEVLNGHFPWVRETSPVLGRVDHYSDFYEVAKVSTTTHVPLVRGYMTRSDIPVNRLDGSDALLKVFLKGSSALYEELPLDHIFTVDKRHLERSGRPRVVGIKLGYGPAY